MEKKDITIYDIAEKMGLSPSTISKGLRGHPTISLKTQKKIASRAEAMGYRFNNFAANLRKKKSNTIGLIVPRLDSFFMSLVIAGIEKVTNERSYNLIISQSMETMEKEIRNVHTMLSNRVDGLLVSIAEQTKDLSHFDVFSQKGIPLMFFDRVPMGNHFPYVAINNEQAGYQVTKHLIECGAKNIVHITGNQLRNVYVDRLAGYKLALSEASLTFKDENLIITELTEASGVECANRVMDLNADAVFIANDLCAASCMKEVQRLGIKVPQQMLFAGFNNDMISRNVTPALTTIDYPAFEMGVIAAKNLLGHLDGNVDLNLMENTIIKSSLIIRESSCNPD